MKPGDTITILGIYIQNRVKNVPDIQQLFTEYGCSIKTRLGLHDTDRNHCAGSGLILLELIGDLSRVDALTDTLNSMDGITVQKMVFANE